MTTERTGSDSERSPGAVGAVGAAFRDSATTEDSPSTFRRVLLASCAGSFVEYYDFAVYAALSPVISRIFFPEADRVAGLLNTLGIYAIAFLIRPIGGALWGRYGDKIGRQTTL